MSTNHSSALAPLAAAPIHHKYKEEGALRGRDVRAGAHGYGCDCCKPFYDAILQHPSGRGSKALDPKFLQEAASRHRGRHSPDHTPPGYWEVDTDSLLDLSKMEAKPKNDHVADTHKPFT